MLMFIEGLPEDTLGIEAAGKVTHEDYQSVLIPTVEKRLTQGPLKLLYIIGSDFTGYEPRAVMDDTVLGFRHWHEFPYIALVTEIDWVKNAIRLFAPFFPGEVRLFPLSEQEDAKNWIQSVKIPTRV